LPPSISHLFHRSRTLLSRGLGSRMVSGFVLVAVLTVVSKAVSFVKDAAVARQFGISDELDAFMFSFGLLTFIAALIGGGLPEAFLPLYAEVTHLKDARRARRLAVQSSLIHVISLVLVSLIIWFIAPQIVGWTTRGFSLEKQMLAVTLLRTLLPFMVCFGLSYQLGTWLRADKHFAVASSSPMIVPLTIITWLVMDHEHPGTSTLVNGTVVGAALHLLVLTVVLCRRDGLTPSFLSGCLRDWEPEVRGVIRNSLPFLFAGAIFSSAVVVDQTMASWLEPGSVAVLGYTDKVCGIILAVTVAPSCDVLFPYFADKVARRDWAGVKHQLFSSAGIILSAALPAALLLCWLAPWVITLLFERGSFTPEDTQRVAGVLRFAALQIPFYILGSLASRVVVAMQATNFIIVLSFIGLVGNAVLNWVLMQHLGAAGIALATVIVQMISALMACLYVLRQIGARIAAATPASSST
jgi:putative peptidoglycan lipid II flippase